MPMSYSAALTGINTGSPQPDKSIQTAARSTQENGNARPREGIAGLYRRYDSRQPHPRSPKQEHRPNTASHEECVYVLTLLTTPSLSIPLNELRKRHFPARLNRTPAHLTLFHALPHSQITHIEYTLSQVASRTDAFRIKTGRPFRMRRGVGISMAGGANDSKSLHAALRDGWLEFLSEQDKGGWRPHWTIQNKVDEEETVQKSFHEVSGWAGAEGRGEGFGLWRYERGNWEWVKEWRFN